MTTNASAVSAVDVVPGRDVSRMIDLLFGRKTPAKTVTGKTWDERELFTRAVKGKDLAKLRFLYDPNEEFGTWLLDGSDRWDTIDYASWIGSLERCVDPSQDIDGMGGSLPWAGGFFWLPICGLTAVAYQQNEGGVDVYFVSGLLKEKTATVYSWLTQHTSGGTLDLRFDAPSISHLLAAWTERDEDDEEEPAADAPKVCFRMKDDYEVDPDKYWDGRWDRPGFDQASDPQVMYWRARWILTAIDGSEPKHVKQWLEIARKFANWEKWRVRKDFRAHTVFYWILYHYIFGNRAELAETLEKARTIKGFPILAEMTRTLSKPGGVLEGFPLDLARKALLAAGEKLGTSVEASGSDDLRKAARKDAKVKQALALLDGFERQPNRFTGPNPWYRTTGSEQVQKFASLVDDRFHDLLREKVRTSVKVDENKPGATRGVLLAWGKVARDYADFKDVVSTIDPDKLEFQRQFELWRAYGRFLDEPDAVRRVTAAAQGWIKDSWNSRLSSEPVWTLLQRNLPETHRVVAELLRKVTFGGPTWDVAQAAAAAAQKYGIKSAAAGLRRARKEGLLKK